MANIIPGNPGTISGSLIGLTINNKYVSCETSCDFNFEVEMIDISPITSGRWRESLPGIRSWNMNVNGNLLLATVGADVKTVLSAVLTGEKVDLAFRTRGSISPYFVISGQAYPKSGGINAANTGKANWNIAFQGTGPFEVDLEEFWLIINAMPIEADKPVYIDTEE